MDFNTALHKVGDFGLYQKLLCACLVVPSASFCALVYFAQFFIIMVPHHRCKLPEELISEGDNTTVPFDALSGEYEAKQCSMSVNMSDLGIENSSAIETTVMPCEYGYVYDFSELYPTIATELNWVCDRDHVPYWMQTIFYIGTSLGCMVFGLIADRYGRRPSIILSYIVASTAGVASAFCTSAYTFAVLRFFVGSSIIPLSEDPYVLSLEYIGVKKRTLAIVLWASGYIIFSALCPWIAYGLRNWQVLCIVTSAPLAMVALFGPLIPESASWLLTRGRTAEAVRMLKTVAKINGREFPQEFENCAEDKISCEVEDTGATVLDLFRTPRLRRNSAILAAAWFIVYCCYHTNTQNASNLGTNIYDSFTYSALVEIPSQFVILFGIDWLGRRWPIIIASAIAGVAGLLIILSENSPKGFLTLALIQRVTLAAVYCIIIQYSSELYPTVLRGRGLACLRIMGTMGLYLSPSIVYLALTNPTFPLLVSGCLMLIIAVFSLFLPETLNHHLPHTIQDAEKFGADQQVLDFPCLMKRDSLEEECREEEL